MPIAAYVVMEPSLGSDHVGGEQRVAGAWIGVVLASVLLLILVTAAESETIKGAATHMPGRDRRLGVARVGALILALPWALGLACAPSTRAAGAAVTDPPAAGSTSTTVSVSEKTVTVTEPAKTVTQSVTSTETKTVTESGRTHTVTQTVQGTPVTSTAPSVTQATPTATSSPESGALPWWAWVLIGLGALGAAVGAYFYGQSRGRLEGRPEGPERPSEGDGPPPAEHPEPPSGPTPPRGGTPPQGPAPPEAPTAPQGPTPPAGPAPPRGPSG
jgi:drug/metabolite transporter (DMT)-like permease